LFIIISREAQNVQVKTMLNIHTTLTYLLVSSKADWARRNFQVPQFSNENAQKQTWILKETTWSCDL